MKKNIICIVCPKGCIITVEGEGKEVERIENSNCSRGYDYAINEFTNPCRVLTSSVKLLLCKGRKMLPVRSTKPIPKELLFLCMEKIKKIYIKAPVKLHQVVISDICGTGIDIVTCMPINKED